MGETTKIAWSHRTFNPWMGCAKVSPGCDNCYMFRDMPRYGRDPSEVVRTKGPWKNVLKWDREQAEAIERTAGPSPMLPGTLVFTGSWCDVFGKEGDPWRDELWETVKKCPHLIFQMLTKRHGRIEKNLPSDWGDGYENVWLGVSAEDRLWWDKRVGVLRDIPARTKFVSYEPALGSIAGASAKGIHQIIFGGESSPARTCRLDWAREAKEIARRDGAAFFMKQVGAIPMDGLTRLRLKDFKAGADMSEWPEDLRIQEWPRVA